ncbi:MAG: HAD-IIIA family hydrolase [Anaerolineales bacterium]|jgi:D-glycero-D-manno-heptose 1,7-bisphosphate phosphatase|nr:HAD-IIIA family hydrolase [Anaerolineales bacterium]
MQPAVFLDRDGVIIENQPSYVRTWQDVKFLPGALEGLARLACSRYRVVLVSNQAGIGRGLIAPETAEAINQGVLQTIRQAGGRIDAAYICPHKPEDGCTCRKPRPGMLLQAASELGLDLAASLLIGDNLSDLLAGKAGGVGRLALVRSGLGSSFEHQLERAGLAAATIYDDLAQAIAILLENECQN